MSSTTTNPRSSGPETALARALELLAEDRGRDAVDLLVAATDHDAAPELAGPLVQVRHRAAAALVPDPPGERTPVGPDPFEPGTIPEIAAADLTPDTLAVALAHHGSLLVRGFLPTATAERLLADVHRAFAAAEAFAGGAPESETAPWYVPFDPAPGFSWPTPTGPSPPPRRSPAARPSPRPLPGTSRSIRHRASPSAGWSAGSPGRWAESSRWSRPAPSPT